MMRHIVGNKRIIIVGFNGVVYVQDYENFDEPDYGRDDDVLTKGAKLLRMCVFT
jgi:hypothetical protein